MTSTDNNEDYRHLIEPFKLDGDKGGCLLLHGFTGSPSEFRPLGKFLSENGYAVSCPLLPGHGTTIEDLENYTWRDWDTCAQEELLRLRERHEKVFVIGLSMGGALALHVSTHQHVDGVVALATGVKLRDWRVTMLPVLRLFIKRIRKTRNAFTRGKKPRRFAYNYNSSIATGQLLRFYQHIRGELFKVTAPLLLINSKRDRTIPIQNVDIIMSGVGSATKKSVLLERDDHIITLCDDQETVHRETLQFITSLT